MRESRTPSRAAAVERLAPCSWSAGAFWPETQPPPLAVPVPPGLLPDPPLVDDPPPLAVPVPPGLGLLPDPPLVGGPPPPAAGPGDVLTGMLLGALPEF
jgi:hypothetical protein